MINLLRWSLVTFLLAGFIGSLAAFFLWALDLATTQRLTRPWLLWLLPFVGGGVAWVYWRWGQQVEAGIPLLLQQAQAETSPPPVPLRMLPLIIWATVMSHFVGASVGREGTAIQMGGALADQFRHQGRWSHTDRRRLLLMGISAGFGGVFGTPWTATVFALEVADRSALSWQTLIACLLSAWGADLVAQLWGVAHQTYPELIWPVLTLNTLLLLLIAALIFGATARLFLLACQLWRDQMQKWIGYPPLRPVIGGLLIILLIQLGFSERSLGLGLPVIHEAFEQALPWWEAWNKLLFTFLSLGSGFKGGEVTPLFFIGATLGNSLAWLFELPLSFLAALGLIGLFSAATQTPWAATMMGVELFGLELALIATLVCWISSWIAQRLKRKTPV